MLVDTVCHANKPSSVLPQTWASILCFTLEMMGMGSIGADFWGFKMMGMFRNIFGSLRKSLLGVNKLSA